MAVSMLSPFIAYAPPLLGLLLSAAVLIAIARLPGWITKLRLWQKYSASHRQFALEAVAGKYKWIENPWSSL